MSDLHLRANGDHDTFISSLEPRVDVQLIAGDVVELPDIHLLRQLLSRFQVPIVFVPGNHEYYLDRHPDETEEVLMGLEDEFPNLRVLIGDAYRVPGGPRIVGTTLWYRASPELALRHRDWADFRYVGLNEVIELTNRHFLRDESLLMGVGSDDIVVTHMLPSWKCVIPRFENHANNELFVRDVEPLILDRRPLHWVHGHTHATVDVMVGDTRVLCNPRGVRKDYGPENPVFDVGASFEWSPTAGR